jgi:hypothetical protein
MTREEQQQKVKNIDLGKTQITDLIRVSSAALHRDEWFGSYWLVETWVFSDDPRQRTFQVIHGDCTSMYGERPPHPELCDEARKIHRHIVNNLRASFADHALRPAGPRAEGGGG